MISATPWRAEPLPVLRLPAPPGEAARPSFPILATVAPVIASIGLWAVTQSPFALLFALLGPVVAVASLGDNLWQGRRRRRREFSRFEIETDEITREIASRQRAQRVELEDEFPVLVGLLEHRLADAWPVTEGGRSGEHGSNPTSSGTAQLLVRIGTGDARGDARVESDGIRHSDDRVRAVLDRLCDEAVRVPDGPVVLDAGGGIGFCGEELGASAAARACVIRIAYALDPARHAIRLTVPEPTASGWGWLDALPHRCIRVPPAADEIASIEFVVLDRSEPEPSGSGPRGRAGHLTIAAAVLVAPDPPALARKSASVVELCSGSARLGGAAVEVRPEFLGLDQARVGAGLLTGQARRLGLIDDDRELAAHVQFSALDNRPPDGAVSGLDCIVGSAGDGLPWVIDLVSEGPHAAVGGVTGSGKSELLTTWLLALAVRHPPERVNFLLVDFKGGATFGAIARLPHSVGLITDLDPVQAGRALESLKAELTQRERMLQANSARAIEELPPGVALPRLVIVVDEFHALSGDFPELRDLFADLAARGRSLGIHLILCTQRPAATLRDTILANCTLRICLRVNDPADSVALIGTPAAASLPRAPAGRALVSDGGAPGLVQIAIAEPSDLEAALSARPSAHPVRRPWCDPLPATIPLSGIRGAASADPGIVFGMADLPAEQRQAPASWRPDEHGHLLVLGAFGSGKSAALAALAAGGQSCHLVGTGAEAAWDAVTESIDYLDGPPADPRVLLIDDIDSLVDRFEGDHRAGFVEALQRLLRHGPAHRMFFALSARSIPAALRAVAAGCDSRLLLRMPDRSEHVVAGGRGADFDERMPAGGGYFRSDRVQVGWVEPGSPPLSAARRSATAPSALGFAPGGVTAVVSGSPARFVEALGDRVAAGAVRVVSVADSRGAPLIEGSSQQIGVTGRSEHLVLVGEPDDWQGRWAELPVVRANCRLVFHRASVADFRALTRSRELPPALSGDPGRLWVVETGRRAVRGALERTP